jgi:ketosteroid isomerase-like protein
VNLDAESTDVVAEIGAARRAFIDALARGDATGAAAAYADDARLLAPSTEVLTGRASVARFWQAGIDAGMEGIEIESDGVEIEPGGAVATEMGRYVLVVRPARGPLVIDRGTYLLVYRRVEGAWRRAAETFNPDLPSVPPR